MKVVGPMLINSTLAEPGLSKLLKEQIPAVEQGLLGVVRTSSATVALGAAQAYCTPEKDLCSRAIAAPAEPPQRTRMQQGDLALFLDAFSGPGSKPGKSEHAQKCSERSAVLLNGSAVVMHHAAQLRQTKQMLPKTRVLRYI